MQRDCVTVRLAEMKDVDGIHSVEQDSFSDAWSKESFENEIGENETAHYFVAEIEGNLVGYMGYWQILDQAHITNVAVLPAFRRRGIAKELLSKVIETAKGAGILSFTLECRVSNAPAIALYESLGFKAWGIRPKYYLDNREDAIIMWLESEEEEEC
ncbi:MAG: ribosomal protein S18-alanine N-acetyltransferase [Bacillota bacterium]|nr:ribosomal protein S18-alanine N-acetyltransferase [Bacillota bacterium]